MIWIVVWLALLAIGLVWYNRSVPELPVIVREPAGCCGSGVCDDGYPLLVEWNRAQIRRLTYRDMTGYESAKRRWEDHRRASDC